MSDARFEDGGERPLRLSAATPLDLQVISALLQDAVAQNSEARYRRGTREFSLLVNRFRWEDAEDAKRQRRPFERVQSLLLIRDVQAVRARGLDPQDKELVFSVLGMSFDETDDGAGSINIAISGEGEIALSVESLNLTLTDMSRPYLARAVDAPSHPD